MKYYVSIAGSDNNPGTHIDSPFRNAQRAADLVVPGDEVNFLSGVYSPAVIARSGSYDYPIIFQVYPGEEVWIDGVNQDFCFRIYRAGYIYLLKLGMRKPNLDCVLIHGEYVSGEGDGCLIDQCDMREWGQRLGGYEKWGVSAVRVRNGPKNTIVQRSNLERKTLDWDHPSGSGPCYVHFWRTGGGHKILFNKLDCRMPGGGLGVYDGIGGGPQDEVDYTRSVDNVEIAHNEFRGSFDDVIETEGDGRNLHVHDNLVDAAGGRYNFGAAPIAVGPAYYERNIAIGAVEGIFKLGGSGLWPNSLGRIYVRNNTLITTAPGANGFSTHGDGNYVANLQTRNNIILVSRYIKEEMGGGSGQWDMDYDVCYTTERPITDCIKHLDTRMGWDAWRAATGQEAHGKYAEPMLDSDYIPIVGSPCIDAGVIIPGVNDNYIGSAPDVGAAESGMVVVQYTLNVLVSGQGTTSPAGSSTRSGGSVVLVTALPAAGYKFIEWLEDSAPLGSENPINILMDSDRSITAVFEEVVTPPGEYAVTVTVLGQGTIQPVPDTYIVTEGSQFTITATPTSGWKFDHWEGDVPAGFEKVNPLAVLITGDASITAVFTEVSGVSFEALIAQVMIVMLMGVVMTKAMK